MSERVITIDDLLISDVFFANIDEAKAHWDYRSEFTRQSGQSLAYRFDKNIAQVGLLAARSGPNVTGGFGGTVLAANALYATDSTAIIDGLWKAAQALDEKDVPQSDRTAFFRPLQYYLIARNPVALDSEIGGSGSYSEGTGVKVAGIEIVKTNHLPNSNVTSTPDSFGYVSPAAYQGDFTTSVGLIMNRMAVGTVQLLNLAVDMEYQARYQGTLIVSKYALGHGVLNSSCAVEMKTA